MHKLTVFCAVWHKDGNREKLLQGHMANLSALSVPVERIYIFDGNDCPPSWLQGDIIISKAPLTIYEAWNLALSRVTTPYVMNLNLDDRLHAEAAEKYIRILEGGADLVGGEWEICFNQAETDNPQYTPILPFHVAWPPKYGIKTKLGSGSGERGTFGPACAWRMNLHAKFPRYPYRFADGNLIRVIGDLLWWYLLQSANAKLVRIPDLVGKYHSHPSEQAEFRGNVDELAKFKEIGASIL